MKRVPSLLLHFIYARSLARSFVRSFVVFVVIIKCALLDALTRISASVLIKIRLASSTIERGRGSEWMVNKRKQKLDISPSVSSQ